MSIKENLNPQQKSVKDELMLLEDDQDETLRKSPSYDDGPQRH